MASADDIHEVLSDILGKLSNLPLMGEALKAVESLHKALTPMISALTKIFGGGVGGSGGSGGGGSGGGGPAKSLSDIAKVGMIAAAALTALVVAVHVAEEAFNKAQEWVRLFNPGIIEMFQMSLDNLGATIGRAFVPMFETMTGLVIRFTSILAPVMSELLPVIKQIADVMGDILLNYMKNFGSLLQGLVPLIGALVPLFDALGQYFTLIMSVAVALVRVIAIAVTTFMEFTPLGVIIKILAKAFEAMNVVMRIVQEALDIFQVFIMSIVDALKDFLASIFPVKDVMTSLKDVVHWVIRNMYVLAVTLSRFAGLQSVADSLIKHVEGKLSQGDTAAQQAQIKDIEQLSKDLALAAAKATGAGMGNKVEDEKEFWKRTLDEMKAARDNGLSIQEILIQIREAIIRLLPGGGAGAAAAATPGGGKVGGGGLPASVAEGIGTGAGLPPGLASGILGGILGGR